MDTHINDKGRKEAEKLALRLEKNNIEYIYSSSMERAKETAEIVSDAVGIDFESSPELKEISRAHFEGEKFEDLVDEITSSDIEDYLWCPEGGESLEELKERSTEFFNKLKHKHRGDTLAIISHGGTISATIMGILEHSSKNTYRFNQDNCCINEIKWSKERGWEILSLNDTHHLY